MGFHRERDDEGPWCEQCGRAILDDEDDWVLGLCPECELEFFADEIDEEGDDEDE